MSQLSHSPCKCQEHEALIDVTEGYQHFVGALENIEFGNWVKLMRCPVCGQYWKVDEWDKYQTLYAFKLQNESNWQSFDLTPQIKSSMIKKRGGLQHTNCMRASCKNRAVKGSAYCVDHLYEAGWRV